MAISLTHTTVAVGTDAGNGEIRKAQWNEAHTLTMATARLLGRTTAGAGAVEELSLDRALEFNGLTLRTTFTTTDVSNWNTAYGWGNHAGLYLTLSGAGNKSVSGVPYVPETTLSDGSTITWNFSTANVEAVVTLGGNRTLAMSNIPPAGTYASLRVIQDGATPRTLAFGSGIDAGDQGTPTLSTGAGKEDILNFRSNGTVMQFLGVVGGFA